MAFGLVVGVSGSYLTSFWGSVIHVYTYVYIHTCTGVVEGVDLAKHATEPESSHMPFAG